MSDFTGKVGLVTGSGSGIGRAIASGLARRGAAVAVLDLDEAAAHETAEAITAAGGRTIAVPVDIADEGSVHSAIRTTVTAFGQLDLAVNNAGVASSGRELTEMTAPEWERVLRINLTGTFFCVKHEIPELRRAGGGAIVNIASGGGLYAIPRSPAYVAGKHGVIGLTKAAAVDYASDGIRVNALAPGMTRTAKLEQVAEGTGMIAQHEALTPLGRLATPDEIADAAIWLCSDESAYITGTTLSADGGRRA
ncbi:2-hydroxycyclohexanecarboxyl-CoA dehydrogenase [Streptomyces noursei ZPM]|uniref:Short-chain alcohol dehydrogenase-like protein n=1 Tax=Streptomyces noursei TaxID=1971 RepID=A0A401QSA8_STRNR|nr:glucose 1-dehydrogenase [Streptomyces noursei]AKA01286.1 2-hydroxycyclohexanecarboxyl-CoA dehydrogenase [Streptomyces noursei ZPM]EOT05794.1 2-hydroxycyclohexanecarboxyl-CoA dehydrogenase [Streptomyces noursei CCRC 11814]EXU91318.1 2-hydroxycyclohexanecarboxyl-CoA dehydrogenase [Streptomyces noursei PD-1]GCB88264.1 short-chain alcohol dehydrogenase-like protein [Streptomyces noursei]